jgi:hypothetical protein
MGSVLHDFQMVRPNPERDLLIVPSSPSLMLDKPPKPDFLFSFFNIGILKFSE